jgi:hypothetical protein
MPKRGFTAPIGEWIADRYASMFRDEVLRATAAVADLLDMPDIERRFRQHRRGEADHGYALWAVWVLERWFQDTACRNVPIERTVGSIPS